MRNNLFIWIFVLLSAVLMSVPWLVPHMGILALVGFVPLLIAEELATQLRIKGFWKCYFSAFVLWNAFTTFWVCNASVGGGIFAIIANAFQMSVIFSIFRFSKKHLHGVLPYIFLAAVWIAWERWYLCYAEISWPWLVLGNAFADTTSLVQWYEYTGTLGGSLWIWTCNLGVYAFLATIAERKINIVYTLFTVLAISAPIAFSRHLFSTYQEKAENSVDILIAQPNFDPYQKFTAMTQTEQTGFLLNQFQNSLDSASHDIMMIAPETFTSDVKISDSGLVSPTLDRFSSFIDSYEGSGILFGASSYEFVNTRSKPSELARPYGDGWIRSHNSAVMLDSRSSNPEIFHKSKLVVGTELTPYPKIFVPLENWLCELLGTSGLMGHCEGQDEVSLLHFGENSFGCAVCYESVFGEYCTDYVRKGAEFISVITNDAWWGDTPGYRQHFNYSRLRAIELRRDVARCANTGISAFIDQKGDVLQSTGWWKSDTLRSYLKTSSYKTFFVRYGDITGRICTLLSLLLLVLVLVKALTFKLSPTGRASVGRR